MGLEITLTGPDIVRTIAGSRRAIRAVGEGTEPLVAAASVYLEIMKALVQQPGTGIVYRRRGRVHRASAPGEPPASDEGRLIAGLGFDIVDPRTIAVGVGGPAAEYALLLEQGTRFMDPRPYILPAVQAGRTAAADKAVKAAKKRTRAALAKVRRGRR